jgi:class 3 adenylate cyclase
MSSPAAAALQAAIAALEAQRGLLGDAVVDVAVAPLRAQLAALEGPTSPPESGPTSQPEPAAQSEQTLRRVSILFLDVVGSTSLSQKLDPEQTHEVMDGALARCTAMVQKHRGRVLQYAGDNLLAIFAADEGQESGAERAVRAGLDMLAEGRLLGQEVLREHGHEGFDVRVGVHTGSVLLGGGVDAEGSIRGMAVNIAARMEQTAPAGALRISQDTWRHVRGVFEFDAQPPIAVKGIEEPIASYLVLRAKPRAFRASTRGLDGVATRMVGRDAELGRLQAAFERLIDRQQLEMLLVVAEPGVGKSRLLYEFTDWAELRPEKFFSFHGRADPHTLNQPFGLLRDVLAWRLQIADTDSVVEAKAKVEHGIVPLFEDDGPELAQAHAHLLGHLIGLDFSDSPHVRGILDDPKQIRTRAFHAAAQAFRRFSARGQLPIVLQLDDLHWADDGSLEFLKHLVNVNHDVPMLILCLTRATLFERRPDLGVELGPDQRIDLFPLGKAASGELARELLKRLPAIPDTLSELLIARADGNPFYMEELVMMLLDRGVLKADGDAWSFDTERVLGDAVPPTLVGILQARLDGLPPGERLALQEASVVGMVFWEEALAALDEQSPRALPSLVRRELALPHVDTSLDGEHEYGFRHQLLHEVTYETVLKRARRALHARAAEWFASLTGVRAAGLLGAAAWHYEQGGDPARAVEYYARAAEDARQRYAHEATLNYVFNALRLIEGDDEAVLAVRWPLLDIRERTYEALGKRPEQHADLDALGLIADQLDDDQLRGEVATRRSLLAGRSGDLTVQERIAREGMALAERCDDTPLRLNAMRLLADALARQGSLADAEAIARKGLAEARALRLPRPENRFLNNLIVIAALRHDTATLLTASQQATALSRELGDRRNEAIGLASLGAAWMDLGDLAQARSDLEESLRLLRAMGDRPLEPLTTVNLSILALWQGDASAARAHAVAAREVALEVRAKGLELASLWCLGNAELLLQDLDAADAAYAGALGLARASKSPQEHDASAGLARVALARGDLSTAAKALAPVLALIDARGSLDGTFSAASIQAVCWQVLNQLGDERARPLLQQAHEALFARAAELNDPVLLDSFLTRVPPNQEIVAAWAAAQAAM